MLKTTHEKVKIQVVPSIQGMDEVQTKSADGGCRSSDSIILYG